MKKLVQINVVCNGSTGRIMCDIAKKASEEGFEAYCFFGRGNPNKDVNCIKIDTKFEFYFHALLTRLFNLHGHGSYFATKRLVKKLRKINPDIIHLHNIHGYYLNLKVLFKYLKKEYKGKIIWTLHDCWAFTGHCSHFVIAKCQKWKNGCNNCPQIREYPKSFFIDTSKSQYLLKKKLFTKLSNLTIVTPSNWLAELVNRSFLKDYKITVINNGVDLGIFTPTYDEKIYDKYSIPRGKKIILGVANIWTNSKGINDFIKLSEILNDDYIIIIVGKILKKVNNQKIIFISRTENAGELAKLYTIAHVFFNPTYEDNYPTTNLEAIACGTPVIAYDTGGNKEIIDIKVGKIVNQNEISRVKKIIKSINQNSNYHFANFISKISKRECYMNYIHQYGRKNN